MMQKFEIDGVVLEIPDALLNPRLAEKMAAGKYEANEARAARMRVKKDHRVLELGGGVGYISSICAQITDPANIVTVEANPNTLNVIRNNLDLNGASAAKMIHAAVVSNTQDSETAAFRVGNVFWGSSIAQTDSATDKIVEVPTIGLFDLFENHRPHVVIMDIEGAEEHLFDQKWPRFIRQVILEIHPTLYGNSTIKTIVDCMSKSGMTYDPGCSRGAFLGFRRVFEK